MNILVQILIVFTLASLDLFLKSFEFDTNSLSVFSLYSTANYGFFGGLIDHNPYLSKFFIFLGAYFFLCYLFVLYFIRSYFWQSLFLSIFMAGIFSNYLERLLSGYVTDYFAIKLGQSSIILNLADLFIFLGLMGLFIYFLKNNDEKNQRSYIILNYKNPVFILFNSSLFFSYLVSLTFFAINTSFSLLGLLSISVELLIIYAPFIFLSNILMALAIKKPHDQLKIINRLLDESPQSLNDFQYRETQSNELRPILEKIIKTKFQK